ncbi:MAG: hypothetical protein MUF62_02215 [Chitinophagaceae bacterium]|jgi:hypothetical protein|nr:hypothetical protein [Chitinophagaceae bacterium]
MWNRLTTNWHFARLLRLVLGILVVVQSVQMNEKWFVVIGALLAALAIFDLGGCNSSACATPTARQRHVARTTKQETTYEEVDEK